ncbi:hypothetical protein IG631_09657 [Alternaria alternata]|nr:hypothetical protein IG631_09657 [Alternaria alternata]
MRKAVLEADFGRSREPVNGLRFDVLAPLTTPAYHSKAPAAAISAFEPLHIKDSLQYFLNISSSINQQASRINEKKKVACQIAVNVLPSSATRSRKPVS